MFNLDSRKRILVLALGLCLAVMLGASLYKRFTQPGLTISRLNGQTATSVEDAEDRPGMDAIGALMRQVAQNPRDRNTLLRLVEGLMSMGEWQSAENFAQKVVSLEGADSLDVRPLYLLALIHHNQGRHAQAAELLEQVLKKSETPQARYSLGILYLHYLNNPKAGIENLQNGLADPNVSAGLKAAMREELEKAAGFMGNSASPSENRGMKEMEEESGLATKAADAEQPQNSELP